MKKIALNLILLLTSALSIAQNHPSGNDTTTFKGRYINSEYSLYIHLDAYAKDVLVPDQEVFGQLAGYLGDNKDSRKWLFTDSHFTKPGEVSLSIINDYGSEDLVATFTRQDDSTFVLRQREGSTLKVARNKKWTKLPKNLVFVKQTAKAAR